MRVSKFDCVEGTLRTQVQKSGYRLELNSVLLLKYTNLKGENRQTTVHDWGLRTNNKNTWRLQRKHRWQDTDETRNNKSQN